MLSLEYKYRRNENIASIQNHIDFLSYTEADLNIREKRYF